jgi:hypothetical protein
MLSLQVRNINRTALFSFVGAPRPGKPGDIRMELIEQCNVSARCTFTDCTGISCGKKPTSRPFCFHGRRFLLATWGRHSNKKNSFWLHDCWVHTHILSQRFCIYAALVAFGWGFWVVFCIYRWERYTTWNDSRRYSEEIHARTDCVVMREGYLSPSKHCLLECLKPWRGERHTGCIQSQCQWDGRKS